MNRDKKSEQRLRDDNAPHRRTISLPWWSGNALFCTIKLIQHVFVKTLENIFSLIQSFEALKKRSSKWSFFFERKPTREHLGTIFESMEK
jgi:hypothetical protein